MVGAGDRIGATDLVTLPDLLPVSGAPARWDGRFPTRSDPIVRSLLAQLKSALLDCDACWVHNAFTVYLNPALTVALIAATAEVSDLHWVAWCYDITGASQYQPALTSREMRRMALPLTDVTYVAPTAARAEELRNFLRAPDLRVEIITPPIVPESLLAGHPLTREIAQRVALFGADLVALVPAKLLPHKRLDLVVEVAASLRDIAVRPVVLITGARSPHEASLSDRLRGELLESVRRLCLGDTVHILSDVAGVDLPAQVVRELMLLADMVLVASDEEGFGLPLAEAAALRVPVLCSDLAEFAEAGHGWAHTFSHSDSPGVIAARMVSIARNPANGARRRSLQSAIDYPRRLRFLLDQHCDGRTPAESTGVPSTTSNC
ncbi:MAG: hypothetical protein PVSMB7_21420 [Chloroflexota bacterium]